MKNDEGWRREVIKRLERIEELLEKKEVEVDTSSSNILDRYSGKKRRKFWAHLRNNGKKGVDVGVICSVFDLRKSQGYDLMKKIPLDYGEIGKVERKGNKASKLVNKKHYLADLLGEDYPGALAAMKDKTGEEAIQKDWETLLKVYADNVSKNDVDEQVRKLKKAKKVCEAEDMELPSDSTQERKRQEDEEFPSWLL